MVIEHLYWTTIPFRMENGIYSLKTTVSEYLLLVANV